MVTRLFAVFIVLALNNASIFANSKQVIFTTNIRIDELKDDQWQVTLGFSDPVVAVAFLRQRNRFRAELWSLEDNNLEVATVDGMEVIRSKNGEKFNKLVINHKTYFKRLPKDYYHFFQYSDGGKILYTGHYNVEPLERRNGKLQQKTEISFKNIFSLKPKKGHHVLVNGRLATDLVEWVDKDDLGTYAYFGTLKPIERKSVVALIDSDVPDWAKELAENFLPKLFTFYSKKLARPLDDRPAVFLTYSDPAKDGFGNKGGTLPGVVQLDLLGEKYKTKTAEGVKRFAKFLAHEAAHLWNSQMFSPSGSPWIHEGGADAFAYRALLELGVVGQSDYQAYLTEAATRCSIALGEGVLSTSGARGKWSDYYYCGSTFALATEQIHEAKNLFKFWIDLFELATQKGGKYSEIEYFEVLDKITGGNKVKRKLGRIASNKQSQSFEAIADLLKISGLKTSVEKKDHLTNIAIKYPSPSL